MTYNNRDLHNIDNWDALDKTDGRERLILMKVMELDVNVNVNYLKSATDSIVDCYNRTIMKSTLELLCWWALKLMFRRSVIKFYGDSFNSEMKHAFRSCCGSWIDFMFCLERLKLINLHFVFIPVSCSLFVASSWTLNWKWHFRF